ENNYNEQFKVFYKECLRENAPSWLAPLSLDAKKREGVEALLRKYREQEITIPLHWQQALALAKSFLDDNGTLRRENWGMAEMKIAVGYLQGRRVEQVGGLLPLADDAGDDYIIRPIAVAVPDGGFQTYYLGYQFYVSKPKEMLFVFKNNELPSNLDYSAYKKQGIYFAIQKADSSRKYYWADDFRQEMRKFDYDYIIFANCCDGTVCKRLANVSGNQPEANMPYRRLNLDLASENWTDSSDEAIQKKKNDVYGAWIKELTIKIPPRNKAISQPRENLLLCLQTNCAWQGAERGLFTNYDLLKVVLHDCFHTTVKELRPAGETSDVRRVRQLIALYPLPEMLLPTVATVEKLGVSETLRKLVQNICDLLVDLFPFVKEYYKYKGSGDANVRWCFEPELTGEVRGRVSSLLVQDKGNISTESEDLKNACGDMPRALVKRWVERYASRLAGNENLCTEWLALSLEEFRRHVEEFTGSNVDSEQSLLARILGVEVAGENASGAFVAPFVLSQVTDALYSAFQTSEIFLRKYQERIVTLPKGMTAGRQRSDDRPGASRSKGKGAAGMTAGRQRSDDGQETLQEICDKIGIELYTPNEESSITKSTRLIKYCRHDSALGDAEYAEGLSGAQSYLNVLESLVTSPQKQDTAVLTKLVENALMRVLIIDERVHNFLTERKEQMIPVFSAMRMWVVDVDADAEKDEQYTTTPDLKCNYLLKIKIENGGLTVKKDIFDMLIIHQGIIDKWLNAHDEKAVDSFLKDCLKKFKYVAVTTGRGRPDNIPSWAKVLPFSAIESSLFQRYPEKLHLVSNVMNLLPNPTEGNS
ncbi:MAG: hypothetical protein IKO40_05370, partial [Kiritimatiellae bacterium]|nr:hypothetical protein [Kiritimatiellia bacterium]